jgi:hypothetical protein
VFLKQGPLTKQCRNKDITYEFFLFNDMLVYAAKIPLSGLFKLHRAIDIDAAFRVCKSSVTVV